GGGCYDVDGGGGGGSSFPPAATSTSMSFPGTRPGNGKVSIIWPPQAGWAEFSSLLTPHEEYTSACHCNRRMVQPLWTGDPVNMLDGSFTDERTDLAAPPGRGPALAIARGYDSAGAAADGPFGYGWAFNYGMKLT